jgi:hypothetical protein
MEVHSIILVQQLASSIPTLSFQPRGRVGAPRGCPDSAIGRPICFLIWHDVYYRIPFLINRSRKQTMKLLTRQLRIVIGNMSNVSRASLPPLSYSCPMPCHHPLPIPRPPSFRSPTSFSYSSEMSNCSAHGGALRHAKCKSIPKKFKVISIGLASADG